MKEKSQLTILQKLYKAKRMLTWHVWFIAGYNIYILGYWILWRYDQGFSLAIDWLCIIGMTLVGHGSIVKLRAVKWLIKQHENPQ